METAVIKAEVDSDMAYVDGNFRGERAMNEDRLNFMNEILDSATSSIATQLCR